MPEFTLPTGVTRTANGFRLREFDGYVIECWGYLFNWRLVLFEADNDVSVEKGYCYFGRDLETLARAVAAGLQWDDPVHTDPAGFDKRAF